MRARFPYKLIDPYTIERTHNRNGRISVDTEQVSTGLEDNDGQAGERRPNLRQEILMSPQWAADTAFSMQLNPTPDAAKLCQHL